VARHAYSDLVLGEADELLTSFLHTDKLPNLNQGKRQSAIHNAVKWAKTGRGGRNYDLLAALDELELADEPGRCSSVYQLCE
jgi:hypothetical protein